MALLNLKSIEAFYGATQVLFGIDIEVRRGKIVCLLGGNASGKSTMFKVILGLLSPRSGDVFWDGKNINKLETPQRIRLGMASVPEARRIFPDLTVDENILLGAFTRKNRADIRRDRERVLSLFPRMRERLKQAGGTLSGGEQQMLAMARALMSNPTLICMDEPTMGLSPLYVDKVLDLIQMLNKEGITFFMVEQNAPLALEVAHYGYILQTGHIALQGSARDLLNDERIQDAYLGGSDKAAL